MRYNFEIPNGETLADKSVTVKLPSNLKMISVADEIYAGNDKIADATFTNDSIKIVFLDTFLALDNRNGFFDAVTKYIPTDATLDREEITFTNVASKTIYYNPKLIPPAFKKTLTPENGKYKVTLSVRPGNKRPNPDTQEIALTETLDNIKLIETDKVTFNGAELVKDDKYAYTENTTGTTGHTLDANISMASLDNFNWYNLVYYASVDSGVFGLGQNEVKLKTSLGAVSYLDTNGESKYDAILTDTMKETTLKTALVSARYDVVANTHLLKWTVDFNTPEINITNPTAYIKYGIGEQYLEMITGGTHEGVDCSIKYGAAADSLSNAMTFTETGSGTGEWGSTTWQPNFSTRRTLVFYTKIKDEFYKENRDGYKFKMDVSMKWYPVGGSIDGIRNEMVWADGFQQGISNSLLKKTFASYDAETGQATWNISLNANKNDLKVVTITDILSDGQTFVDITATSNGASFTDFTVDSTTNTGEVVIATTNAVGKNTIDFTIVTKLSDAQGYANSKITIKNGIAATGDGIATADSNASKEFDNTIIKKEAVDYNIATREVTWKLDINKPFDGKSKPMTGAKLTDYVYQNVKENNEDVGHKLVDNKLYNSKECTQQLGAYAFTADTDNSEKFTLSLGNDADKKQLTLYYKTVITNTEAFNFAGKKLTVKNRAELAYTSGNSVQHDDFSDAEKLVEVDVVKKNMYLNNTNKPLGDGLNFIRNEIVVNQEYLMLKGSDLVDVMTVNDKGGNVITPLSIDMTTMKLVGYSKDAPSTEIPIEIVVGDSAPQVGKASLVLSAFDAQKGFKLILPEETSYKYKLLYNAKVTDRTNPQISVENAVAYTNNGKTSTSTAKGTATIPQSGASGDTTSNGTIKIQNVDIDKNTPISYSNYVLCDSFGNVIGESKTDTSGKLEFNELNTNNVKYYIKEILPGLGYKLNIFEGGNENNPSTIEVTLTVDKPSVTETVSLS